MEYYAHYNKETNEKQLLKIHLDSVAKLGTFQVPDCVNFDDIDNSSIRNAIYCIGYYHDLGKYSDYFQDYLIKNKNSKLKNHAHISACYVYKSLRNNLSIKNMSKASCRVFIFLCYLSVRLHHTCLRTDALFEERVWKEVKKVEKHLKEKGKDIFDDLEFDKIKGYEKFIENFDVESMQKNKKDIEYIPLMFLNGRIKSPKWYFLLIYLFSILIDTDKLDSAYIKPHRVKKISSSNVTRYLNKICKGKEKSSLIDNREEARITILKVIDDLTDEDIKNIKFFTLTAPTGIGKTLSSLQCALKLQERIEKVEGYIPRIITAIPFINIIEQNKKVYENVISSDGRLVVHHRLTDFYSQISNYEETSIDKALLETEAWDGDVILTTFVQLFHSIFTGKNKPLKKINKLAGSIVILDEAQAIPEDYMPVVGASLRMISKYYGTRFILMTATQPRLLEFGDNLLSKTNVDIGNIQKRELLPNNKKYFEQLHRTRFIPILEKRMNVDEFCNLFFEKWEQRKSVLVVVNTIKRSIEVYQELKNELEKEECNVPIYYLSTNIIPQRRRYVIDKVKMILDENSPVILVSTQTIEAGVDLDFDMGFRDFAPLDSLIQTAGRVNREGKKGINMPVYIIQLEKDNHYVYNLSHRQSTLNLLKEKKEIEEKDYGNLIEEYYKLALNRGVSDESRHLWEDGIIKLDFNVLEEFKLIDNIGEVADVFVEKDETASELADAYEELLRYKEDFNYDLISVLGNFHSNMKNKINIFERKALIRLVMSKMNDYIIQIRVNKLKNNRPVEFGARGDVKSSLFWVPFNQIEDYYDKETGFIDNNGSGFIA